MAATEVTVNDRSSSRIFMQSVNINWKERPRKISGSRIELEGNLKNTLMAQLTHTSISKTA